MGSTIMFKCSNSTCQAREIGIGTILFGFLCAWSDECVGNFARSLSCYDVVVHADTISIQMFGLSAQFENFLTVASETEGWQPERGNEHVQASFLQ